MDKYNFNISIYNSYNIYLQLPLLQKSNMKDEEFAALFKYCDKHSLLICTWYGKLKTLFTPITVKVCKDIGHLKKGDYAKVTEIKLSTSGKTVFIIDNKPFYYHSFDILTHL